MISEELFVKKLKQFIERYRSSHGVGKITEQQIENLFIDEEQTQYIHIFKIVIDLKEKEQLMIEKFNGVGYEITVICDEKEIYKTRDFNTGRRIFMDNTRDLKSRIDLINYFDNINKILYS